jgi:hypothetical protein
MSSRGNYKTPSKKKIEVLNKLYHRASIQSVMNQYGVSRPTLCDIKENHKRTLKLVLKQDDPCSGKAEKQ